MSLVHLHCSRAYCYPRTLFVGDPISCHVKTPALCYVRSPGTERAICSSSISAALASFGRAEAHFGRNSIVVVLTFLSVSIGFLVERQQF